MINIIHLDLNVTRHCNLRCVSCSHGSPFTKAWYMTEEMIERDLNALKPILKPQMITIVGGEPTLHPKLVDIIKLVKKIRIDDRCMVITNGKLLPKMSQEFWKELEILKISIYPTTDPAVIELAKAKVEEFKYDLVSEEFPEFFQQFDVVPDGSSFYTCPWKADCYTVHDGYFYLCPQSAFFPSTFLGLDPTIDGLPLEGITHDSLEAFMTRTTPLRSCHNCRAYGPKKPWKEEKNKAKWMAESTISE